jgi:hypothetical protein
MKKIITPLFLSTLLFTVSCSNESEKNDKKTASKIEETSIEKNKVEEEKIVSENFEEFNNKFHSDSDFQLSRIKFPLKGKLTTSDGISDWTKKNWSFITVKVSEKQKDKEFKYSLKKSDSLVIEKYWMEDTGFSIERKFELIDNNWFLVYYNELNV